MLNQLLSQFNKNFTIINVEACAKQASFCITYALYEFMIKQLQIALVPALIIGLLLNMVTVQAQEITEQSSYLAQIKLPKMIGSGNPKNKILIAIVDDGIRTSHKDINKYIWNNPLENPENGMDDDGNGYVNDINGWDLADNNNSVIPPLNTRFDFYHGTHLAGIITRITESIYGDNAPKYIKIIPVKSIKNEANTPYIKYGYQGIEYAINAGADIILTAWGVGHVSDHESKILKQAKDKGILVVAAAGNLSTNSKQYPAAEASVLSVAALDIDNKKIKPSNFGAYVDISAPGEDIYSASFSTDSGYEKHTGTSQSSAIITAVAAIVKLQNPAYSWEQVKACIKNSADQIDAINPRFSNKLGAGAVNLAKAIACDSLKNNNENNKRLINPQGYLNLTSNINISGDQQSRTWSIKPNGRFKGIRFRKVSLSSDTGDAVISVHKGLTADSPAFLQYSLASMPDSFYIPGATASVRLKANSPLEGLVEYKVEPIDFTTLYCSDTKFLKKEGVLEDGSGADDYSYNSSCKWLITAPQGKVIRFNFAELNTEAKIDKLYFFNGEKTNGKIMALISGSKLPPEIVSWGNKVLIWFVSDGKNQGQGWKFNYSFEDL